MKIFREQKCSATFACMHENPDREDFRVSEIVDRTAKENVFGRLRPGVIIHANQHCVANRRPNPGNYRMLYETRRGMRRLFKDSDDYHPYRKGGKPTPQKSNIPGKYWPLLDWYDNEYNK